MTDVFHRRLGVDLPRLKTGNGMYVEDFDGRQYLDASSGGVMVSALGHNNPEVIAAIKSQLDGAVYFHGAFFTTDAIENLASALVADAPPGLTKAFFTSGGSEAVEVALMMARQTAVERGERGRRHVIAREQSYHGATLYTINAGYNLARREPFGGMTAEVAHIAPCNEYRGRLPQETQEEYGLRASQALENKILELGPENVLAFIAETVGGGASGATTSVPGYFKRVREICDKHNVYLILDEVLCGMGRTGSLHACVQEGISPDLLTIAKGLGAGYQPIGAVLVSDRIYHTISEGSGVFRGGYTFSGHAVACASALAVQQIVKRDNLVDNVRQQGEYLRDCLIERFGNHANIGNIRGRGLLQAIEIVQDRVTKKPFDKNLRLNKRIGREAMALGLICAPETGNLVPDGGDHIGIAPPYIVNKAQIREIVNRLGEAVDKALSAL